MKSSLLRSRSTSTEPPAAATVLLLIFLIVVAQSPASTVADKDSDYYYPGVSNPNAEKYKMYWKDSINVLQDLDQFEALYIKYHGCVWTKYGTRYGSGENYDEQGADQEDGDNGSGCGGWGGEYFWYMGRTQCFRANVAYSLYGILAGGDSDSGGDACKKSTYINSFFTTFGAESFAGPLGLGVDDASSQCTAVASNGGEQGDGDGDGDGDDDFYSYVAADDDYLDDNYQFYDYASYTSYGTGCSAKGKFVTDQYSGAFCHGRNYLETLDALDSFNEAVESMQCTRIYSASNGDEYQAPEDNGDGGFDFEDMSAVTILSFSKSCSLRQYPKDCPDPYGLKKKYAQNIERAFAGKTGSLRHIGFKLMNIFSFMFLALGLLCWFLSYRVLRNTRGARREARRTEREKRRRFSRSKDRKSSSRSRSRSKSSTKGASQDSTDAAAGSSIEKVSSTVSEFSHKSWTSLGRAATAGAEAAASVCSKEGNHSQAASTTSSSKSPSSRMKQFFSKKKNKSSTATFSSGNSSSGILY